MLRPLSLEACNAPNTLINIQPTVSPTRTTIMRIASRMGHLRLLRSKTNVDVPFLGAAQSPIAITLDALKLHCYEASLCGEIVAHGSSIEGCAGA